LADSTKKLKPHSNVVFTQLSDGEAVLLNLQTKLYYSLNGSGTYLWQFLEQKDSTTKKDLVAKLSDHYQIPSPKAANDVQDFLQDLSGEGLLEETR